MGQNWMVMRFLTNTIRFKWMSCQWPKNQSHSCFVWCGRFGCHCKVITIVGWFLSREHRACISVHTALHSQLSWQWSPHIYDASQSNDPFEHPWCSQKNLLTPFFLKIFLTVLVSQTILLHFSIFWRDLAFKKTE